MLDARRSGRVEPLVTNAATWVVSFAIATVLGLAVTFQVWLTYRGPNRAASFWNERLIQPQLIPWYVWASLAPPLMLLMERLRSVDRAAWQRGLIYAGVATATILVQATATGLALGWWWSFPNPIPLDPAWHIADQLRSRTVISALTFTLIVAVHHLRRRPSLVVTRPEETQPDLQTHTARMGPLALRVADRVVLLNAERVDWIEADGDYVIVHIATAKHRVREPISAMEARLPAGLFVRVSRSAIVNIDFVREIQPWFRGNLVLILNNGVRVTTGARYRDRLTRRFPGQFRR